jgi:hypothetical protein
MRILTLLLAASLAFAQDKPPAPAPVPATTPPSAALPVVLPGPVTVPPVNFEAEVITVKTLTGDSFNRLVDLLKVFRADIRGDSQLRTIVVYAPRDVLTQVHRVIDQMDRPGSEAALGKNIEMTLTLLRCSPKAPATPEAIPPDMESVVRQLRNSTQYKDIEVWDVVPMHLQEGMDARETLRLPGSNPSGHPSMATIQIHPDAVYRKDQGRAVRFSRLYLDFKIPVGNGSTGISFMDSSLHTSGDFMEGQKTVLGKVSGNGEEDAIFAVIALKVLD